MKASVVLLVPVKQLSLAKSRLRASPATRGRSPETHAALVLAMALDTVAAASAVAEVAQVVVITSDDRVRRTMTEAGVDTILERGLMGLNPALALGSRVMRERRPELRIGALNADLPSLRPAELSAALQLADGRHAFCRDRAGTGTTLLLAGMGEALVPCFGTWSASAHLASGATELTGCWPSLRCDVDTESDLAAAASLGFGRQTQALLSASQVAHAHTGS